MMHSVALRLSLLYLAIIMALSISFSLGIYSISSRELARHDLPPEILYQLDQPSRTNFEFIQEQRQDLSRAHVRNDLVILNVLTLVVGAIVSYGLARRTLQPIEEAFIAQGRFSADASHELRTPLTAMQTTIEVGLRNPKMTLPQAKELMHDTLEEVQKLSALANGLLKLTRSNGRTIPKKPVAMKDIVDEAATQLASAAHNKHITVKNTLGALMVPGDAVSLKEVMTILLDNAIKYGQPKTAVVITGEQHGKFAAVSVTDQGNGIAAEDLAHIFDRFYRADMSRSREHVEGYGLGLSIAQKIVEAHGGSIDADSKPGEGSTFTIKLPIA